MELFAAFLCCLGFSAFLLSCYLFHDSWCSSSLSLFRIKAKYFLKMQVH
jgi:hypothetical protein